MRSKISNTWVFFDHPTKPEVIHINALNSHLTDEEPSSLGSLSGVTQLIRERSRPELTQYNEKGGSALLGTY